MRRPRIALNGIVVLLCLIALLAPGNLQAARPTKTITGIVESAEVYGGKVRAVYINDPQEGSFLVVRSTEMGKKLLKNVGATVKATGYLRKARPDSKFKHVIDVLHYEIDPLDEPAPVAEPLAREDE
jgi:hypothetical protein